MQRFAKGDKTAQREISKQATLSQVGLELVLSLQSAQTLQAQSAHDEEQALRRAIRGQDIPTAMPELDRASPSALAQDPNQSDDSEAVDLSDSDDDEVEMGSSPNAAFCPRLVWQVSGPKGVARQTIDKAPGLPEG